MARRVARKLIQKQNIPLRAQRCFEWCAHTFPFLCMDIEAQSKSQYLLNQPLKLTQRFSMSTSTKATKTRSTKKAVSILTKKLFPYSGSKHKYRAQLQNMVSKMNVKKVSTYIEPFAGSLGSFFHITEMIEADNIILNDINPKMTNIFQQIKDNPQQVTHEYSQLEKMFQSLLPEGLTGDIGTENRHLLIDANDLYLSVRKYINEANLTANHAAAMIFVLNHNFSGVYRESKEGDFNTSFRWESKRIDITQMFTLIYEVHTILSTKNVEIYTMDVFQLLHQYNDPDTFIYLDPPYVDSTAEYVADSFDLTLQNQIKLIHMTNKYNYVMYSNHHHEAFASFFDNYVNFYRTNKVSKKPSKKPPEIMAYKINKLSEAVNNIDVKPVITAARKQLILPMMDIEQKSVNKSIQNLTNPSGFTA